jgi:biopolymer transport protein TolR
MGPGLQPGGPYSTRHARRRTSQPISEINVTPLVGVMAVLLIIFMVAAPRLTVDVDIDTALPQVEPTASGVGASGKAPLNITVDADGKIFLENAEIGFEEVVSKLIARREADGATQVSVRGDNSASYGAVTKVLVRIKEAGLPVILVTEPVEQP